MFHFSFFHLFLNQIVFIELSSYIWLKVFTWFTNQISKTINMKKNAFSSLLALLCSISFTSVSQPATLPQGESVGAVLYINPK